MALENLVGPNVFISNLARTNPAIDDPVSQGDDHLRGIKNVIQNTFPNVTGAVTLTQAQINGAAPLADPEFTGIPKAPTAAPGTNTTQIATTAFVQAIAAETRTWQNVTGSRAPGVTYTNDTGREIVAILAVTSILNTTRTASVGGLTYVWASAGTVTGISASTTLIIPPGVSYSCNGAVASWLELR